MCFIPDLKFFVVLFTSEIFIDEQLRMRCLCGVFSELVAYQFIDQFCG